MKKYFSLIIAFAVVSTAMAQETVYPAPAYKGLLFIKNGNVHVGNGQVLPNTTIKINNGKIESLGTNLPIPMDDVKVIDATGKEVYPGLISSNTNIGIREISGAVRGSNDYRELGDWNPNVESIKAYNADSRIINTLRSNGILLANIAPQGSLIAGSSSTVQYDAWTWEDALYKENTALHFYMPSLMQRQGGFGRTQQTPDMDPAKAALNRIELVKQFLKEAKSYNEQSIKTTTNLKLEACKNLFNKTQKLFIHCNLVKEMLIAVDFVKELGLDVVVVGGSESFQIAPLLKQHNIPVILNQMHSLPTSEDDDVDQPFKTPTVLQKAGVLFAINDADGNTTGRNLAFNAGTAAAYGLSKEEALQAITLNAAKILGIDKFTGSIEAGKDANIIISEGDVLDMRSSKITHAFIQGRTIDLTDKHKLLNERYKKKYNIK
ncbi:MAG TPA: amidohydrolase family protein [Ferruginibacter sp.]|nr:amidohydrolase family protein [Ferruginibacter sp.]HRE64326.1 amidohydrolase family protein [Ferruginibacter sp.]